MIFLNIGIRLRYVSDIDENTELVIMVAMKRPLHPVNQLEITLVIGSF